MIKQPTTRKLAERKVLSAVDKDGNKFQKLFPDEKFYQFPGYPKVFVSQYANIITTNYKIPRWCSPYYNSTIGYTTIILCKHGIRKLFTLHEIVAEVWLQKPSFQIDNTLQVHHKIKVRDNLSCQPINLNFAEQLQYTYLKYHPMLDSIETMEYFYKKRWHKASEPEEIALAYGVSDYSIYKLLYKDPTDIKRKYKYFISGKIKIRIQEVSK